MLFALVAHLLILAAIKPCNGNNIQNKHLQQAYSWQVLETFLMVYVCQQFLRHLLLYQNKRNGSFLKNTAAVFSNAKVVLSPQDCDTT